MNKKHLFKLVLLFTLLSPISLTAQILPRPVSAVNGKGEFNLDVNTTIIVEDNGKEIKRLVGEHSKKEYEQLIKETNEDEK